MKIRMMAVAALALSAACGGSSGAAPEDGPAPQRVGGPLPQGLTGGGGPNVFVLLGAREQLALTSAQVTDLDSIGRGWSVRNDSLARQLQDMRGRATIEEMHPFLERMAMNNQVANGYVEAVLNADQRRIACTLTAGQQGDRRRPSVGGRMTDRGGRIGGGGQGRMRPGRGGADTIPGRFTRSGWPWCTSAAPADSAR